ncbi:MAG: response regulator [Myxococcaceae bacterium]|nr:response regulator [Myxococcaceae bacterium]
MTRPLTILYVDPDPASKREVGEAFNRAGVFLRSIADPTRTLEGARALTPDLILVHSEVRGPVLEKALAALAPDAAFAGTPLSLFCEDTSEARFLDQLRTGVVALLQKPFYAPKHVGQVRALMQELPGRTGTVSGNGDTRELTALVEHIRRMKRSGQLVIDGQTEREGRALFVRGTLGSAEHRSLHGVEALLAMVTTPRAPWSFSEVGATPGDVVIDLRATTGEYPLAPAGEIPVVTGLPIEVGEVAQGEEEVPIELALSAVPQPAFASPPSPPGNASDPPIRLLLVDDDEALCRMFSVLFQKHGFEVATEEDGFSGYERARREPFEIVVADLNMPRMDGWGLLRLLRDDFQTRELPVAFLSCHDDYRETLRALDAGAQAYFSKATRLDALAGQVRALLDPRRAAAEAIASAPGVNLSPGRLGPQWVLRQLSRQALTGVLEAKDSWATYRIALSGGTPIHAMAQAGRHIAEGERAFNAFVASKGAEGTFTRLAVPATPNLHDPLDTLIAHAIATLNQNEAQLREGLLVHARQIHVEPELYALYTQVGPKPWLETARLICEERLPPREVIARVEASPLDVEETLKDLIRRGVVRLTA